MWTYWRRKLGRWLLGPDLRHIRDCRNRRWAQARVLRDREAANTLNTVALGLSMALDWLDPPPPRPR